MPSSKRKEKAAVIALRKEGKTYSEIREIYAVPKGTLSDWLKNVKIPAKARREMKKRSYKRWKKKNEVFIKKRIEEARKNRLTFENEGKKEIKRLTHKDLKLIGSALYWAEGSVKNRNFLRFANADSEIIRIIMKFFRKVCGISDKKIKARVHIYPGINYQNTLNFWRKITKLRQGNFYKPQIQVSRASQGKRKKNTLPYGTLHLTAGNTKITCKVKGWIKAICKKIYAGVI